MAKEAGEKYTVELKGREAWGLIRHASMNGGFTPKGADEAIALSTLFAELGILNDFQDLQAGVDESAMRKLYSAADSVQVVTVTGASHRFFLEKFTEGHMLAAVAIVIAPFIQRMKDVKLGTYKAPGAESEQSAAG